MISNTTKNVSRRHLCSVTAPRHPMKPTTMITDPVTMKRLAAESDGKEMERVANFPWVTANQTPTPRIPHPPSQKMRLKMNIVILMQSRHPRVILIFLSSLYGWRDRGGTSQNSSRCLDSRDRMLFLLLCVSPPHHELYSNPLSVAKALSVCSFLVSAQQSVWLQG